MIEDCILEAVYYLGDISIIIDRFCVHFNFIIERNNNLVVEIEGSLAFTTN